MQLVGKKLSLWLIGLLVWVGSLGVMSVAQAQEVVFVSPQHSDDYIEIREPEPSTAYFGELSGYPHTYRFVAEPGQELSVQIIEPDIRSATQVLTGIVVSLERRGVAEVARLRPDEALWQRTRDGRTGDTYLLGPSFQMTAEEKTYLVEVSTAENVGKYVLQVGYAPAPIAPTFLARFGMVYQVKQFHEKSLFSVFLSPYYYVPVLLIVLSVGMYLWWRRQRLV